MKREHRDPRAAGIFENIALKAQKCAHDAERFGDYATAAEAWDHAARAYGQALGVTGGLNRCAMFERAVELMGAEADRCRSKI